MDAELLPGDAAEHGGDLLLGHGRMRPERGHDVGKDVPVVIVDDFRDRSRIGVEPGEIRRQRKDTVLRSHGAEHAEEGLADLLRRYAVIPGTSGVIQHDLSFY